MYETSALSVPEIIRKKRDKLELSEDEIKFIIDKVIHPNPQERIHDAQLGAFLMASFLNGLSDLETLALLKAMTYSGSIYTWPRGWKGTVLDKHSTGGVGDKVSLILAPALAALGFKVPMISGRGLGHTGGTLDKLESIPGFSVSLDKEQFERVVGSVGCCISGQTAEIAPADKIIYSVRDTTATVDNEDFIVASIISKKASEGLDALILDVKVGQGAMMKEVKDAKSLASKLVRAGNLFGIKTSALITRMEQPLGAAVGNALEVAEALESLQNKGPRDLLQITLALGAHLLESSGACRTLEEGEGRLLQVLQNGGALEKFKEMLIGQGTQEGVAEELCYGDKWKVLPKSTKIVEIRSNCFGFVEGIDALAIARFSHALGCGRNNPTDPIKYEPGVVLLKKVGDFVEEREPLLKIHLPNQADGVEFELDEEELIRMMRIGPEGPSSSTLVVEALRFTE